MIHLFPSTEQYFYRKENTKAEERTVHRQQTDALHALRYKLSIRECTQTKVNCPALL